MTTTPTLSQKWFDELSTTQKCRIENEFLTFHGLDLMNDVIEDDDDPAASVEFFRRKWREVLARAYDRATGE